MKRVLYLATIVTVLFTMDSTLFAEESIDEQIHKEKARTINEIREKCEPSIRFKSTKAFPSGHPEDAVSGTFGWGYGSLIDGFNIYVWRQGGSAWVKIAPLSGHPFICSSSFVIIQNGVQYDTVKLEAASGDSQCGDVYITSVFELTQWSFYENPADLNKAFTLLFDGGENAYTLDLARATSDDTPIPSPASPIYNEEESGVSGGCFVVTLFSK